MLLHNVSYFVIKFLVANPFYAALVQSYTVNNFQPVPLKTSGNWVEWNRMEF